MVDSEKSPPPLPPTFGLRAWRTVIALGVVLALAGLTDISLAFYPPNLGSAPWRFTTFVSVMNGLPVLSLGLLTILMAGIAVGSRTVVRIGTIANAVLLVGLVLALIGIATSAGATMAEVPAEVRVGIRKAMAKGVAFGVIFGLAHALGAVTGFRATTRPID